jgi:hypothetical protein
VLCKQSNSTPRGVLKARPEPQKGALAQAATVEFVLRRNCRLFEEDLRVAPAAIGRRDVEREVFA